MTDWRGYASRQSVWRLCAGILVVCFAWAPRAGAQLSIEITGGGGNRIPVAILPLAGENQLPDSVNAIVRADLERSGQFQFTDISELNPAPSEPSQVRYAALRARGADAALVGTVTRAAGNRLEARVWLLDVVKQTTLGSGQAFSITVPSKAREAAHRIADFIYERLTGERGNYSTRIAYVLQRSGRYELRVADADGLGEVTLFSSPEPLLSPSWSPDGTRIAYVSFEKKKPIVFVIGVYNLQRSVLANYKGSNSAPSWSPDGRRLAIVLAKEGGSQIFTVNADGTDLRRVSNGTSIDTEPIYSPDGTQLYFTSDRGGTPQIYRMSVNGGDAQRVTYEGPYNTSPHLSPDGKLLTYISNNGGRFQAVVLDLATRQTTTVSDTARDESPSFSPNGKVVLYATEIGGRGVLATVAANGSIKQKLSVQSGTVREPAWGPFPRN